MFCTYMVGKESMGNMKDTMEVIARVLMIMKEMIIEDPTMVMTISVEEGNRELVTSYAKSYVHHTYDSYGGYERE